MLKHQQQQNQYVDFCEKCLEYKEYRDGNHKCKYMCPCCHADNTECEDDVPQTCTHCNRRMRSHRWKLLESTQTSYRCFDNHKVNGTCVKIVNCIDCNSEVLRNHTCEKQKICRLCKHSVKGAWEEHKFHCYVQKRKEPKGQKVQKFIIFDLESAVEDGKHAQSWQWHKNASVCKESGEQCVKCNGPDTQQFPGLQCVDKMLKYIDQLEHADSIVLAHNGSAWVCNTLTKFGVQVWHAVRAAPGDRHVCSTRATSHCQRTKTDCCSPAQAQHHLQGWKILRELLKKYKIFEKNLNIFDRFIKNFWNLMVWNF